MTQNLFAELMEIADVIERAYPICASQLRQLARQLADEREEEGNERGRT